MSKANTLLVNEIFFSIQGESTYAGLPCIFVRLRGCPLRCGYCDTEYAFHEGSAMSFDEIIAKISKYPCKLVELTGGEPLAQTQSINFLKKLIEKNYQVLLETSGAIDVSNVPDQVEIIMDVKTPGSLENSKMIWDNFNFLKAKKDQVKFVICSQQDFDYAIEISEKYDLFTKYPVLISPVHNDVKLDELSSWVLKSGLPFKMQLQMHKYIWPDIIKGV